MSHRGIRSRLCGFTIISAVALCAVSGCPQPDGAGDQNGNDNEVIDGQTGQDVPGDDSDADGVPDSGDLCDDTPSGEEPDGSGCSCSQLDDDQDGVGNCDDECPDTMAGEVVDAQGCPCRELDDDEDGVSNCDDQCPDTSPSKDVDFVGCSCSQLDDDQDGVDNCDDQCPDTVASEVVDAQGCPCRELDDDADGVSNCDDQCSDTPPGEDVNTSGCSCSQLDHDQDGVNNCGDRCPDTLTCAANEVGTDGCAPDSDDDSVPDGCDQCPDTPQGAIVDEQGCPIDSDGDGVSDGIDRCPGTATCAAVNIYGCPRSLLTSFGLAYGPFRQHESPDGLQPLVSEIREDLDLLKAVLPSPPTVRVYSTTLGSKQAAIEAVERGFNVILGAWIDTDEATNDEEIASLIELANTYPIFAALVGNEALLRGDVSDDDLADMIRRVRDEIPPEVPVGTAEPWSAWMFHDGAAAIVDVSDVLVVHVHPFWEAIPIDRAVAYVFQRYDEVAASVGQDRSVLLGETGWPSGGETQGAAIPSPEYQAQFLRDFRTEIESRCMGAIYFSAFDEPWKGVTQRESDGDVENEGETGAHWGVFRWNRRLKPEVASLFPTPPSPLQGALEYRVFTRGSLAPGHDMGVNTSEGRFDWVTISQEALRLAYPSDQCWGSVFITVGEPTDEIPKPKHLDLSEFEWLALDIKSDTEGQAIELALKDYLAPDDGREPKVRIHDLQEQWNSAVIPLSSFEPMDLSRLYVASSFNFVNSDPATVWVKDIRFIPRDGTLPAAEAQIQQVTLPDTAPGDMFVDGCLSRWYVIGLDTSHDLRDWMEVDGDVLCLSYPEGQSWGAMFMAVWELQSQRPRPLYQDFSAFTTLSFEAVGALGDELIEVGAKDRYAPDTGRETKVPIGPLSTQWQLFEIPTSSFVGTNMAELYIPFEVVFEGQERRTVCLRGIRYTR